MLNTQDFTKKLEIILDYYQLSASAFADKIGVQRSSLSHLLSGRNKPSLDFVVKICESFPEVDLYWFLMNKGSFPNSSLTETHPQSSNTITKLEQTEIPPKTFESDKKSTFSDKEIEKIVVFYKNGTFKSFNPS